MRKKGLILLACLVMLSGCWDERQLKDVTLVSLFGVEGEPGKVKATFTFPIFADEAISYTTSFGNGLSLRAARNDANHRTAEALDVSSVEVILIAEETAKFDFYNYFDMLYRDPRNRLSGHMAIVQGEIGPYFEPIDEAQQDISTFYIELLDTAIRYSFVPDIEIQTAGSTLQGDGFDLTLPYIKMEKESGIPEIAGVALFSGKTFTGKTLDKEESMILNLLKSEIKRYSRLAYMWKSGENESPLTVEVIKIRKKWEVSKDKIDASYELDLGIEEFPHDGLDKDKMMKELEDFLDKEMTKQFNEVVEKLQEAKSDGVGFGRTVRAFHSDLWDQGDWHDTFAELPIKVKVKANIKRTGILN